MNRKHIHIYSAYQNLVQKFSLFMTPFWHILHFKILCNNAGSEVLTVLLLKIQGFWHVTLCHWVSSSRCFEDNIVFITGVMQSFKCKNEGTMILQNAGKCSSSNIISQPTKHHESSDFVNNITTHSPPQYSEPCGSGSDTTKFIQSCSLKSSGPTLGNAVPASALLL